jgi:hypothetical protein
MHDWVNLPMPADFLTEGVLTVQHDVARFIWSEKFSSNVRLDVTAKNNCFSLSYRSFTVHKKDKGAGNKHKKQQ